MEPPQPPQGQSGWPPPGHPAPPYAPNPYAPNPYGQPPHLPYQPQRGRNGFSIAGLVLGIIPVTAGLLGIIFGLIGRSQSKRHGQKGRVMGTWGAVLGAAWLAIIVVAAVSGAADDAERDDHGHVVKPGHESAFSLRAGDCLRSVPKDSTDVRELNVVVCTREHKGEVYANIRLPYSTYPGLQTVSDRSEGLCKAAFEPFVGRAYDDSSLDMFFLFPTAQSWRQRDRTVTCMIAGQHLVGTVKGSRR
jgi:hypothetical protein